MVEADIGVGGHVVEELLDLRVELECRDGGVVLKLMMAIESLYIISSTSRVRLLCNLINGVRPNASRDRSWGHVPSDS